MGKYLSILFIVLSALFSACENELPYQERPQEPQLLMNAFLEVGKEENEVKLFMIKPNIDATTSVTNGSVIVYVNGEKTETVEVDPYSNWGLCTLKSQFRPGDRVRLEATAEDGEYQANAEVEFPQPIEEMIRVDTLHTQLKGLYGMQDCMRYRIAIHDRPGEKNYYRLIIQENTYRTSLEDGVTYGPFVSEPDIINQEDIVLTDGHLTTADDDEFGILDMTIRNVRNIFTDSRFTNGPYTLNVYTSYPYFHDWGSEDYKKHIRFDVVVRLQCITEAQYRYMRAMNCLDSDDYNETFMEPVIVPQNVSGGLGFVGASSEQQVTLRMLDRPPLW